MEPFPGNSQRARQAPRESPPAIAAKTREVKRVVTGEVIQRKKPFGKRVKEMFLGTDDITVGEYLREDVFIPAIKDLLYDIVVGGAQHTLFPGGGRMPRRGPGTRFGPVTGNINYGGFAQQPANRPRPDDRMSRRGRATHDFNEILIPSRPEAEMVLEGMFAILEQYSQVTVSDLYELVGISSNYAERAWGWTDLRGSRPERATNGYYVLNLPPTVQLD